MPAELDVDREAVRVLVVAVGPREAARQMGISEDAVRQWSSRGGWLKHLRAPTVPPPSMRAVPVTAVTLAADALINTLSERHKETKLGLSKWSSRTAKALGELPDKEALASHQVAVGVASVMSKVWPEQGVPSLRLSMYAQGGPTIEVESEYIPE